VIEKPFQGLRTFCKVSDQNYPQYQYAVIGLPVDSGTSFRSGTRMAPAAIREASMMLTDGVHDQYPVDLRKHVFDLGDAALTNGNISKMLEQVQTVATNIIAWEKHPVFIGGDHSITLGTLRAMHERYGKLAVVHFDAHADTSSSNYDEPIGHGTWLFNAINEGLVDPVKTISIGIRAPASPATREFLNKVGGTTFTARYAYKDMEAVLSNIKHLVGDTPCYLTFDIDCLDPAYAPGTGTPEVGGFSTMWALECLESLLHINWVGMDCVEVCPPYDHGDITSIAAATVIWTYLSMVIDTSNRRM
jgi:agmatinase